jgi:hypothetical protein
MEMYGVMGMSGKKSKKLHGGGMALGIALGVAFGIALDNLAIGIAIGIAMGAGMSSFRRKD